MIDLLEATAFGAAIVFGFRHGFDWDHLAALTDLTGSQTSSKRSMWLATLYALGHAVMVLVLGVVVDPVRREGARLGGRGDGAPGGGVVAGLRCLARLERGARPGPTPAAKPLDAPHRWRGDGSLVGDDTRVNRS